jgi:ribonuclease HI
MRLQPFVGEEIAPTPVHGRNDETRLISSMGVSTLRGFSVATAIDLTGDDDFEEEIILLPAPTAPKLKEVASAADSHFKTNLSSFFQDYVPLPALSSPSHRVYNSRPNRYNRREDGYYRKQQQDVQIVQAHRHLSYWKDKSFKELGIEQELTFALETPPEAITMRTIVPHQYLKANVLSNRRLRQHHILGNIQIEILNAMPAIEKAYKEHTVAKQDPTNLVLWTDGSRKGSYLGVAVVFRHALYVGGWGPWAAYGFRSQGKLTGSHEMEGIAIIKAFDIVKREMEKHPGYWESVTVYSDSIGFLQQVRNHKRTHMIYRLNQKAKALRTLEPGMKLQLCWCPGHSKVSGPV